MTAGADVAELQLIGLALKAVPEAVQFPCGVPLVVDKAYDSDPLRE